jgi:hypothetical protein
LKKFDSNFFDAKAQYAIKINIHKLTDKLSPGLDKDVAPLVCILLEKKGKTDSKFMATSFSKA